MARPKRVIIPVFIPNLGCGHECVFCDQRLISGELKPVSADDVRKAYSDRISPAGAELAFYGGSFTALPTRMQIELLEAAQQFLGLNPDNSIRVSTRPDCVDDAAVERLISFGVSTVELGAQSMCDDVLATAGRGHTSDDTVRASGIIKRAGLSLVLQMMTGLPGDTRDKSVYTARRLIDLNPDGVRIYPTVIIRGTRLYDMWRGGQYREHTVREAVVLCAEVCALFQNAGVPVIRLGLNPSDTLSAGDAAAGAYHPAFGELVYSQMYYNKADSLLEGVMPGSGAILTVADGCVSKMAGQRRVNIRGLVEKHSLRSLKIVESDIDPGEIMIEIMP